MTTRMLGYQKEFDGGFVVITGWKGDILAELRCVEASSGPFTNWDTGEEYTPYVMPLSRGRFMIGVGMGDGIHFRGEYCGHAVDLDDAKRAARELAIRLIEQDVEWDEQCRLEAEQDEAQAEAEAIEAIEASYVDVDVDTWEYAY